MISVISTKHCTTTQLKNNLVIDNILFWRKQFQFDSIECYMRFLKLSIIQKLGPKVLSASPDNNIQMSLTQKMSHRLVHFLHPCLLSNISKTICPIAYKLATGVSCEINTTIQGAIHKRCFNPLFKVPLLQNRK